MSIESNLIIKIMAKTAGYDADVSAIENTLEAGGVDWEYLKHLIIYHEITPFAYTVLKPYSGLLPDDMFDFLKNNYYCLLQRIHCMKEEFFRISDRFAQAGLLMAPIKGAAFLIDIYGESQFRPMVDVDILVSADSMEQASDIMKQCGYSKYLHKLEEDYWRSNQCHIAFSRDGVTDAAELVEVHWAIDSPRRGCPHLPEVLNDAEKKTVCGHEIYLLSPEDNFLSVALHQRRFGKMLSLKYVLDVFMLLRKYKDSFDWEYVIAESERCCMKMAVFFLIAQVDIVFGVNSPVSENRIKVSGWKKRLAHNFIRKNMFAPYQKTNMKKLYLKSQFFLYDNIIQVCANVFNVPKEQFAKFYGLGPYDRKTEIFYKGRLLYIPYRMFKDILLRCRKNSG